MHQKWKSTQDKRGKLLNSSWKRFTQADNDKMRATNESYALKMNIIVILVEYT